MGVCRQRTNAKGARGDGTRDPTLAKQSGLSTDAQRDYKADEVNGITSSTTYRFHLLRLR